MKILKSLPEIQSSPDFYQGDAPVAVTAPFIAEDRVLIGLYGSTLGHACIEVSLQEFEALKAFLYEPQGFRLAVHGIKRIWSSLKLGSKDTYTHLELDPELMAHLLNSGAPEADYTLSHLVHEYLQEDYPLWLQDIADKPYPQVMHEILAIDASFIYQVGSVLNQQIHAGDPDLAFMYTYAEVPLVVILLEMTRYGIGVDGPRAAVVYAETQRKADALLKEVTGGFPANLWKGKDVYAILRRHKILMRLPKKDLSSEDLKRLAGQDPVAAKILEWRNLQTDLQFLRAAAGATRVYPDWNVMTKTSRIYAHNPAIQNVSKDNCRPLMVSCRRLYIAQSRLQPAADASVGEHVSGPRARKGFP